MEDRTEALLRAIQEEADNLGVSGTPMNERLSDMLDRIVKRAREMLGEGGE
jgi:hypothetical protein